MTLKELRSRELWVLLTEEGIVVLPGDGNTNDCGVFYYSREAAEADLQHFANMGHHDGEWQIARAGMLDVGPALVFEAEPEGATP